MILENNEDKRSTIWRAILTVSSILIIIIAAFFLIRMFTANPLAGTWVNEDSGAVLKISENGKLSLTETDSGEESETISASFTVDTRNKIFTVQMESGYSEGEMSGSYDYSVEQDTLTLTEREYGDQLIFVRK